MNPHYGCRCILDSLQDLCISIIKTYFLSLLQAEQTMTVLKFKEALANIVQKQVCQGSPVVHPW